MTNMTTPFDPFQSPCTAGPVPMAEVIEWRTQLTEGMVLTFAME